MEDAQTIRDVMDKVPVVILENNMWRWNRIPYSVLRQALLRLSYDRAEEGSEWDQLIYGELHDNIDEWYVLHQVSQSDCPSRLCRILSNEKWLRDADPLQWQLGLVSLNDADFVFPNYVLQWHRIITRPGPLPGYELLCEARRPQIAIQPSTVAFKTAFHRISDGLLQNLDWSNLLVAGGIVLSTLISDNADVWRSKSSDIDMYVYGLSPADANKKLHHVFDTFRSNLPPGTRTFVVRNSKTITFYAKYPLRRLQIILKLVKSPRHVLLNFDLDVCAMGWDGSNVWMLPRAARALESAFSLPTLSLVYLLISRHRDQRAAMCSPWT